MGLSWNYSYAECYLPHKEHINSVAKLEKVMKGQESNQVLFQQE